jgi:hypothetical protein
VYLHRREEETKEGLVTATLSNGSRAAALEDAKAGMSRPELAAKYRVSDGTAGNIIRASGRTKVRSVATPPVPVVAADSPGEVATPARPTGTSAKGAGPVTSTKAQRKQRLFVAMIAVAALVAGAVGTLSYSLMQMLASVAGTGWHAYILPVALDGMMLCGALCLAVAPRYKPAWIAMGIGLAASMAANGIGAHDPASVVDLVLVARVLSSFAPLCLLLCVVFILHAYKVRR